MRRAVVALVLVLGLAAPAPAADATSTFTHAGLGLTVVATEVALPAGQWEVSAVAPGKVLEQAFLVPDAAPEGVVAGRRMQAVMTERRIAEGRTPLYGLFFAWREYASAHGGRGPDTLADLDAKRYAQLVKMLDGYFLVPGVPIAPAGRPPLRPASVLAVELRPFVDDGKHWVLTNDGRVERQPVDPDLLARHGLKLTFVQPKGAAPGAAGPVRHRVFALLRDPGAPAATLTLTDRATGSRTQVRWSLAGAQAGGPALLAEWARARAITWAPLAGRAPILQAWTARTGDLYGAVPAGAPPGAMREPPRTTDVFGILGGRAALRETLQLELLPGRRSPRRFRWPRSGASR